MSNASVSPHGFEAVRGRGYRPDQVDAYAAALSGGVTPPGNGPPG